jgi:hypothetical protein
VSVLERVELVRLLTELREIRARFAHVQSRIVLARASLGAGRVINMESAIALADKCVVDVETMAQYALVELES